MNGLPENLSIELDRNGYAPSIMQTEQDGCFRCGRSTEKLDRHEIWGGANRQKSKALGLWVLLCHSSCHLGCVHKDASESLRLRKKAQRVAMKHYGWTTEEFIQIIGRNYLDA